MEATHHKSCIPDARETKVQEAGRYRYVDNTAQVFNSEYGHESEQGVGGRDDHSAAAPLTLGQTENRKKMDDNSQKQRAALQKKLNGRQDAFLTKLKRADLSYRFSTLIGGAGEDQAWGVAVDRAGRPYLAGGSDSTDFPTTTKALQRRYKGETDAFVTKFNTTGTKLLYSTYLGGAGYDSCGYDGGDIAIGRDGNAWVVGMTHSPDFPTAGVIQAAYGGGNGDGFVSVINPSGSLLLLSSYVGGNDRDILEGTAPAPGVGAWATGLTGSRNLQTTGSLQKAHNGGLFDVMLTAS